MDSKLELSDYLTLISYSMVNDVNFFMDELNHCHYEHFSLCHSDHTANWLIWTVLVFMYNGVWKMQTSVTAKFNHKCSS